MPGGQPRGAQDASPRGGAGPYSGVPSCAKTIENISRIKMVVARASGTDLASSLKQNTFLTLGVRPEGETGDVVT